MASGAQDIGQLPPKKTGAAAKWAGFVDFLWNSERKEFLGRNCMSWIQISLFYLVYYTLLAGFFGACLAIFFTTIDMNRPKYIGKDNILRDLPGMGVRPLIDHKATLIDFDHEKQSSYQIHINHLQAFLEQYNPPPSNAEVCVSGPPSDPKKVCKFDIADLGTNCTWANKFGYADGQPCVLLKLNRIFDWVPESYANANDTGNPDAYESNSVLVTCNGEHPADIDNMGPVEFFPPAGFSFNYFPYKNQVGYRQPIVMAQFTGITRGIVVQIRCRAWADNILYHKNDKMGSVHFELRVD